MMRQINGQRYIWGRRDNRSHQIGFCSWWGSDTMPTNLRESSNMVRKMIGLAGAAALAISMSGMSYAGAGHAMAEGVMAHGAWVRLVPPVAKNSAAYLEIQNTGDKVLQIESAESPVAEVVEVHQTSMADGVMRMSEVKGLQVPVDGKVTMKPGGYHVMLINLKEPLQKGQIVPVTIKFTAGQELTVQAKVKEMQGKMKHHNH